ncbi:DMT family transporter [Pandoraea terrae]|uniref:DMT family transporter n=1 Tax=Pandoraea terrae TaxID=1537710 RepID=UPI0012420699|nr:DMT family transporter [Pandoraea terrae]
MLHKNKGVTTSRETHRPAPFFATPLGRPTTALLATCLWGSAFPVVKVGYRLLSIPRGNTFLQIEFAGYRFVIASIFLLALTLFSHRSLPTFDRRTFCAVVRVGFAQTFLQYTFFYAGIALSTGTEGAIIAGTVTFFQLGLAHLMHADDRMTASKATAAVIGFSGIVLYHVMANGDVFTLGWGEALMLLAMFSGALGNMLSKQAAPAILPVLSLTAIQMLLGGIGLVVVGAWKTGIMPFRFSVQSGLVLGYLAVVSAVSFLLWNNLMSYNKAGTVSVYLLLVPIFGVSLSSLLLGEPLHWYVVPALAMIAVGIAMTHVGSIGRRAFPVSTD